MRDAVIIPVGALRRVFVMLLVVLALIVAVLVVRAQYFTAVPSASGLIDRNMYQAIFLANGSTYFGKLEDRGPDWFTLTDVFYLSVPDQGGPQLIKRGSEAQGPKEPMIISRQQVLFIENMRDDSDVVALIKRFKSGQLPVATPPPATVAPSSARPSASPSPTR